MICLLIHSTRIKNHANPQTVNWLMMPCSALSGLKKDLKVFYMEPHKKDHRVLISTIHILIALYVLW